MPKEAKSVTRHKKQKEKMDAPLMDTGITPFKQEKTVVQKTLEYAAKHNYKCVNDKGVIIFAYSPDSKERIEIEENLLKEFGQNELVKNEEGIKVPVKKIPFSYGFSTNIKNYSILADTDNITAPTEED